MSGSTTIYSVDASALIEMKEVYRFGVVGFRSLWEFLGGLGEDGRVRVVQAAHDECHDSVLKNWFRQYPGLVVPWSAELNAYVTAMNAELSVAGLCLVNADATTNIADPDVVALALMIEERPLGNLRGPRSAQCHVVCYEARRREKGLAKIPLVCDHYGLDCVNWPEMLEREQWQG